MDEIIKQLQNIFGITHYQKVLVEMYKICVKVLQPVPILNNLKQIPGLFLTILHLLTCIRNCKCENYRYV